MKFGNKFKKKNIKHPKFAEGRLAFFNGLELSDNPYGGDTDFFSKWASGWEYASLIRRGVLKDKYYQNKKVQYQTPAGNHSVDWDSVYPIGGFITGAIAFIACWIYAIASWGFLLGAGLGWIPSLFIAVIAGFIWPLFALVLVVGLCIVAFLLYKS